MYESERKLEEWCPWKGMKGKNILCMWRIGIRYDSYVLLAVKGGKENWMDVDAAEGVEVLMEVLY